LPSPQPGLFILQIKAKTHSKSRAESGEVKASDRKCAMTFSVLGQKFEILPHSLLRHHQLAGGVKAQ